MIKTLKKILNSNSHKLFLYLTLLLLFSIVCIILYKSINNFNSNNRISTFINSSDPPVIISHTKSFEILQNGILEDTQIKNIIQETLNNFNDKNENKNENENELPNILHFIWIGSKIPDKYIENINTYIENNPNYQIWLWHDNSTIYIDNKNIQLHHISEFEIINKYGFDTMSIWAGKADILRYEIIYNYGGMYIDVDSRSLKPFNYTIFSKPFVCIETKGLFNNITNAQFGFQMKSKFLEFVIKCLGQNIISNKKLDNILYVCGPPFFTTCFYYWNSNNITCINQDYVILENSFSYSYHTNDKNW